LKPARLRNLSPILNYRSIIWTLFLSIHLLLIAMNDLWTEEKYFRTKKNLLTSDNYQNERETEVETWMESKVKWNACWRELPLEEIKKNTLKLISFLSYTRSSRNTTRDTKHFLLIRILSVCRVKWTTKFCLWKRVERMWSGCHRQDILPALSEHRFSVEK
jgi:hypothetical protein